MPVSTPRPPLRRFCRKSRSHPLKLKPHSAPTSRGANMSRTCLRHDRDIVNLGQRLADRSSMPPACHWAVHGGKTCSCHSRAPIWGRLSPSAHGECARTKAVCSSRSGSDTLRLAIRQASIPRNQGKQTPQPSPQVPDLPPTLQPQFLSWLDAWFDVSITGPIAAANPFAPQRPPMSASAPPELIRRSVVTMP